MEEKLAEVIADARETQEEKPAEPEPEVKQEEKPQEEYLPPWLYPRQPSMPPPMPPQYYPQYQPSPPPPPAAVEDIPLERLVTKTRDTIRGETLQTVMPLARKVMELDNFMASSHQANVQREVQAVKESVVDAYKNVFSKDPAFANKEVRGVVDEVLFGYIDRAVDAAYNRGDFSGLAAMRNPRFMKTALEGAKIHAGYNSPEPVQMKAGFAESARSGPSPTTADLTGEQRDELEFLARRFGTDVATLQKQMAEAESERKKRGWGRF